ncbi:MAG TPA: hypothetical protein VFA59_00575 [Vicinamibacterales bacterium]|nr:hypothetical protein [Vicinamibacterales bacterium]
MDPLLAVDASLRAEADRLLASGLRDALEAFGTVHLMGSYTLKLMVWRDLDIHIVQPQITAREFFELGGRIAEAVHPAKMHYRNELVMQSTGLPRGLYWGVYLGDERKGAWKIDVWMTDEAGFAAPHDFQERVRHALTDERRHTILRIKSAVWTHPEYRRGFSSADIYRAVIDDGVREVDEFLSARRVDGARSNSR